ncbi:MAG: hypothetical protein Q4B95_00770, partial [Lonepinella koalarum]|nr:hypothetical protein [Lonepinella koalarum]
MKLFKSVLALALGFSVSAVVLANEAGNVKENVKATLNEKVTSAKDTVVDKAKNAKEAVSEKVASVKDTVVDKAKNAKETVSEKAT